MLALYNLGNTLAGRGRLDEAITQFRKVLEFKPEFAMAHIDSATPWPVREQVNEAIVHYQKALEIQPDDVAAAE